MNDNKWLGVVCVLAILIGTAIVADLISRVVAWACGWKTTKLPELPEPGPEEGYWEAVADADNTDCKGFYRVRWSVKHEDGGYLWVGHYGYDTAAKTPSKDWCELAAKGTAKRFNDRLKRPWEWKEWRGRS